MVNSSAGKPVDLREEWQRVESASSDEQVRVLSLRLEAGEFPRERLELAAHCGHHAAARVLGNEPIEPGGFKWLEILLIRWPLFYVVGSVGKPTIMFNQDFSVGSYNFGSYRGTAVEWERAEPVTVAAALERGKELGEDPGYWTALAPHLAGWALYMKHPDYS